MFGFENWVILKSDKKKIIRSSKNVVLMKNKWNRLAEYKKKNKLLENVQEKRALIKRKTTFIGNIIRRNTRHHGRKNLGQKTKDKHSATTIRFSALW